MRDNKLKVINSEKREKKPVLHFVKKYITFILVFLIFLFLFVCDNVFHGQWIINDLKTISTSFTPTTDLFDDGSEVSFVSYFFGMKNIKNDTKAVFYLPTDNPNISKSDEFLAYNYTGTIRCISDGVVSAIGFTTDLEKYIEIEHNEGYTSRYVGFSSFGIATGQMVGARCHIALCEEGEVYRVYLHKEGNLVKVSEIEWAK